MYWFVYGCLICFHCGKKHSYTQIKSVYPSWLLNYTDRDKVVQLYSTGWPVVRGGNYVIFFSRWYSM